jgi:VIT1/CCC1 family predicted Fe2+/Mn2+ transporter
MESTQHKKYDPFVDVVIGLSDGLTIPFAIATALAAVAVVPGKIALIGLAATAVIAIIMAVSGYMTGREGLNDNGHHHHHGEDEIDSQFDHHHHDHDHSEHADPVLDAQRREAMAMQLEMHKAEAADARKSATYIGIFCLVGGLISIAPYWLFIESADALKWSAIITITALLVFGAIKAKLTERNMLWVAGYNAGRGVLLAAAAYGAATIFA